MAASPMPVALHDLGNVPVQLGRDRRLAAGERSKHRLALTQPHRCPHHWKGKKRVVSGTQ